MSAAARLKNEEGKPWRKTLENLIFFFCIICIISTALTETWGGRAVALYYRKTLQVCFWKVRI